MATQKYWRKGRWNYSTTPKEYPVFTCTVCDRKIGVNARTVHYNAHVRKNEMTLNDHNGQKVYKVNGTIIYSK